MRLFQYHLEYRGEVARRRIDDLQYLGRRGLLLQGFTEVTVAGFQFPVETDILQGDRRLVGESLDEFYLGGRKRPCLTPVADDHADRQSVAEDWHAEGRAIADDRLH